MKRFIAGLAVLLAAGVMTAQKPAEKPTFAYGHDFRVRSGGQKDFTKETPKFGVEVFHDPAGGNLVAISEAGHLAVAPFANGEKKTADWVFAHDLRVRKGDEEKFTKDTKKIGVEVFKDQPSGKLLYVTEAKALAFADVPANLAMDKDPTFHHGLVLPVRDAKQEEWTNAKKFGVEAFKDGNTGGLLYVSEAGCVAAAAAPAKAPAADDVKKPKALHGLNLRIRKGDEGDFTEKTRNLAIEVFSDLNTGNLIYVSETGSIAAVPTPAEVKRNQRPTWKHALGLKARKGGDKDFDKATKYGVEVFQDNHTGYLVYACETGSIAVVVPK